MKFIISTILIALLSFAFCLYFPWWSIAVVSFIIPLVIQQKPYLYFITGFFALLLLWGGLAWYVSAFNNHLLAKKITLLIFNTDNPFALIAITALIGAMVAGFSALSGALLKNIIQKKA
jgi:hypothetical protein